MRRPDPTRDGLNAVVDGVRAASPRSIARAISIVESGCAERDELMHRLEADEAAADGPTEENSPRVFGITGPPGAGKSTLIRGLIHAARREMRKVAVLAVDPSSPFSGGALLGDRVRMGSTAGDRGVFIRSMATRGQAGGVSAAALEAVTILGAAGFRTVIVESAGVGQTETGILSVADVVSVVLTPGAGDDIQTLKAGVMEIGDVYVVNKADLPGADDLERSLKRGDLRAPGTNLPPEIVRTIAEHGDGVEELFDVLNGRFDALRASGAIEDRRRRRVALALEQLAGDLFRRWVHRHGVADGTGGVRFGDMRERLSALLATLEPEDPERAAETTAGDVATKEERG